MAAWALELVAGTPCMGVGLGSVARAGPAAMGVSGGMDERPSPVGVGAAAWEGEGIAMTGVGGAWSSACSSAAGARGSCSRHGGGL